jgi:hypothetical protein
MNRFTKLNADLTPHTGSDGQNLHWAVVPRCKAGRVTHKKAEQACAKLGLGGFKDWRLPTIEELFLLADRSKFDSTIDTDFFPDTPGGWTWSSTPCAGEPEYSWVVLFGNGDSGNLRRDNLYGGFVRAVRSV